MSNGLPFLKVFPDNWQSSMSLRKCNLSARGLWLEMMLIMHKSDPYGCLISDGKPMTEGELATLIGIPYKKVHKAMLDLEKHRVFERNADGVIIGAKMIKEYNKRLKCKEAANKQHHQDLIETASMQGEYKPGQYKQRRNVDNRSHIPEE